MRNWLSNSIVITCLIVVLTPLVINALTSSQVVIHPSSYCTTYGGGPAVSLAAGVRPTPEVINKSVSELVKETLGLNSVESLRKLNLRDLSIKVVLRLSIESGGRSGTSPAAMVGGYASVGGALIKYYVSSEGVNYSVVRGVRGLNVSVTEAPEGLGKVLVISMVNPPLNSHVWVNVTEVKSSGSVASPALFSANLYVTACPSIKSYVNLLTLMGVSAAVTSAVIAFLVIAGKRAVKSALKSMT